MTTNTTTAGEGPTDGGAVAPAPARLDRGAGGTRGNLRAALDWSERAYARATVETEWAHALLGDGWCNLLGEPVRYTVIALRGSHELRDFLADGAAVFRRMATGGRAHLGLADSWESVKPQVWARLTPDGRWPADGRHYVVTGHSKGGAEAEACALDLREAGVPWARIHVATFGAPRNKDAARARYYDRRLPGRTARVVHELDAVARVPWSPWPGSWRHVRGKLFITADGRLVREPGWWTTGRSDLRELRRALRELARGRAQELLIGDHLLGGYARDLPGGR